MLVVGVMSWRGGGKIRRKFELVSREERIRYKIEE